MAATATKQARKKNSIDNNNRKMEWVEKRANEIATENREQQWTYTHTSLQNENKLPMVSRNFRFG